MTQDEIIGMAKQAGWEMDDSCVLEPEVVWYISQGQLELFAKLVAAKERDACADMVFRYISQTDNMEARGCLASVAHDIRARGQA
jgi:two-component SAPR family response regulator